MTVLQVSEWRWEVPGGRVCLSSWESDPSRRRLGSGGELGTVRRLQLWCGLQSTGKGGLQESCCSGGDSVSLPFPEASPRALGSQGGRFAVERQRVLSQLELILAL